MERMIDSDLIYNAVEFRYKFSTGNEHEWERALLDLICDKTVEIVPRNHERWVWHKDHWECSRCGCRRFSLTLGVDAAFCGQCGSIMDGKKEDK